MAIRVKHKVNVQIAEDTAMKNKLFSGDDSLAEVTNDGYERQNSGKFAIAALGVESIPLGDVTATKGAFIKFSADCTMKLNGGTDVLSIEKGTGNTWAKFFFEGTITAIEVTAIGALTGTYCTWGDLTV